ncbi:hypothetical protein C8Q76DRAFT_752443 [Earliella scabrosa]|nr:hypothetical protein C8Q76DRAFT_752443 [Earliella scabrosa]
MGFARSGRLVLFSTLSWTSSARRGPEETGHRMWYEICMKASGSGQPHRRSAYVNHQKELQGGLTANFLAQ